MPGSRLVDVYAVGMDSVGRHAFGLLPGRIAESGLCGDDDVSGDVVGCYLRRTSMWQVGAIALVLNGCGYV